jgi:regulator of protease activity HflC (stomatin/prohibitin superfamily)
VGEPAPRIYGPGIHWTFPRPVAKIVRFPTERLQTVRTEAFWYYISPERRVADAAPAGSSAQLDPLRDGYTLTADANLMHSRWVVRYTVSNPSQWYFGFANRKDFLRDELEHAVIRTSAHVPIDKALRTDMEAFRAVVAQTLQRHCRHLNAGIHIQRVDMEAVTPPLQVADAFNAVIAAEQDRSRDISSARAYAARQRNEAKGQADRIRSEGRAWRRRIVSEVSASADYFDAVYNKFQQRPAITVYTLWQDVLRRTLQQVQDKYLISKRENGNRELRLLLSPDPQKPIRWSDSEKEVK